MFELIKTRIISFVSKDVSCNIYFLPINKFCCALWVSERAENEFILSRCYIVMFISYFSHISQSIQFSFFYFLCISFYVTVFAAEPINKIMDQFCKSAILFCFKDAGAASGSVKVFGFFCINPRNLLHHCPAAWPLQSAWKLSANNGETSHPYRKTIYLLPSVAILTSVSLYDKLY